MKCRLLSFLLIISCLLSFSEELKISLRDKTSGLPIADVSVYVVHADGKSAGTISDDKGTAYLKHIGKGSITIQLFHLNYEKLSFSLNLQRDEHLILDLNPDVHALKELVVTATESQGISSSSVIHREAMEHIQPTSFTDLLSLLPGNGNKPPVMNKANFIQLRESGTSDADYATGSLGTSFVVDGSPINTDANMQYIPQSLPGEQDYHRNTTNKGVDMRTISTDEIEAVEILRGISSVEYGDLTNGVVKIKRKRRATPWEARFKTDGFGKLFYAGKGFAFNKDASTLNMAIDFLDSKSDPRDNLINYKRLTTSLRYANRFRNANYNTLWNVNADYTGSFDNDKKDPDLNYMREDTYRSVYNRLVLSNHGEINFQRSDRLKSLQYDANISYQTDRIEQTRFKSLDRDRPMQTNTEPGVHDGTYLPYTYVAKHLVEGKPLSAYVKLKGNLAFSSRKIAHKVIAGVDWKMSKNYGSGQVFDLSRPLFVPMKTRPRNYWSIPAIHQLAFFIEDALSVPLGKHQLKAMIGIRGIRLLNLDKEYALNRMYFDPRLNIQWLFPTVSLGQHDLRYSLSGGIGMHTKMPTMDQLYPSLYYRDVIQLNYWHENPACRRLNLLTYSQNPVNYKLQPARNRKWEIRAGFEYNRNNFSVTYFQELMNTGFRLATVCIPYTYRAYDASGINHETITSPPDLSTLPYAERSLLDTYTHTSNGSKTKKEGVEFQFTSQRIKTIKTRFTFNGAWFRTTYVNSQGMFSPQATAVVGNTQVKDLYIGYYDWVDGYVRERMNTNLICDTYLEKLGLTFSLTLQADWYSASQKQWMNGVPTSYMDYTGQIHPYTEADKSDMYKQWLVIQPNSEAAYNKIITPFAGYLNLKATKDITKYIRLAFFVDKLLDYAPDFKASNGVLIRRSVAPYFGMELNLKLGLNADRQALSSK